MTEHRVGTAEDLPGDGARILTEIDGREVAVFRVDGEYHAVLNYCVHAGGPLCEGALAGRVVRDADEWTWDYDERAKVVVCPWHSWKFDVTTGQCVDDDRYAVPTYEAEEREGVIYVRT